MDDVVIKKSLYTKIEDERMFNEHLRAVDRDLDNICTYTGRLSQKIGGVGELDGGAVNTVFLDAQNSDGGGA